MFAIDEKGFLSVIELPTEEEVVDTTSSFQSSASQVRLIFRDLNGKVCWDATQLYAKPLTSNTG